MRKYTICTFSFLLFIIIGQLYANDVLVVKVDGAINPVSTSYILDALEEADDRNCECLLIELNTPGGLLKSTMELTREFLNTDVPVVVYIAPRGARAASAGVFITMAGHYAVMAPSTHIGAAHPVTMGSGGSGQPGEENEQSKQQAEIMMDKVTNDAVAHLKSIADQRGRNVEWADSVIRKSVSITAKEAKELNIIDFIAPDVDSILNHINNDTLVINEETKILHTANADVAHFKMSSVQKILYTLLDPQVAYILMMLGMLGIFFELSHPGAILPGIVGGISLLLAFYAFSILPINYAGVLLIIFGILLFIIDIKVPSHGMLSLGGIIALFIGSFLLTSGNITIFQISWTVIIPVVSLISLFFIIVVTKGILSQFRQPATGSEGLIGKVGVVSKALTPKGKVKIHGEIWNAVAEENIDEHTEVKVVEVLDRMILKVKKL